jgi:hypothetical protein
VLKALHQQPHPVERRKTFRAVDSIQVTRARPLKRGLEQAPQNLPIVLDLEEIEERRARMIPLIVRAMIDHSQPPHHPIGFQREKELCRRVAIKRMLAPIE